MTKNPLLISIGLPVYNGHKYIRQSLDSLLNQDYKNFELIISDNGSIDETQQICLEYAKRDNRIKYYRSETNAGAAWNFNHVFELASGEYFMWASHDDYFDKRYLSSCLDVLSQSQSVVLVGTICQSLDSRTDKPLFIDKGFSTISINPLKRFMKYKTTIHAGKHIGALFYGLWKRSLMKGRKPIKKVVGCDHILLAEFCFKGEFVTISEELMVKRWGGASLSHESNAAALGITNPILIKCPYLVREILFQEIILKTNELTAQEKAYLCLWSFKHYLRVCAAKSIRRKINESLNRAKNLTKQLLVNIRKRGA